MLSEINEEKKKFILKHKLLLDQDLKQEIENKKKFEESSGVGIKYQCIVCKSSEKQDQASTNRVEEAKHASLPTCDVRRGGPHECVAVLGKPVRQVQYMDANRKGTRME